MKSGTGTHLQIIMLAAVGLGTTGAPIEACTICTPFPKKSAADFLIESQTVVFARHDPQNPFSYKMVETLKGKPKSACIGLFVDSATRRILRANHDYVVVLYRAGEKSDWKNLGVADEEYQQVVRRLLVFASDWQGKDGAQKRLKFFLPYLCHENRALCELAYLELGRAPYSLIRQVGKSVTSKDLDDFLERRQYREWRSLAILMLAQQANEQDRDYIIKNFRDCVQFSMTKNLAAWATAYIELKQAGAIDEIEREYLSNPTRTPEELRAVIRALSTHGRNGHTHLRERIVKSYRIGLVIHPFISKQVTPDLKDWSELTIVGRPR